MHPRGLADKYRSGVRGLKEPVAAALQSSVTPVVALAAAELKMKAQVPQAPEVPPAPDGQRPCCSRSRLRPGCCVVCARLKCSTLTSAWSALRKCQTVTARTHADCVVPAFGNLYSKKELTIPQLHLSTWRCMACSDFCVVCVPAILSGAAHAFYRCQHCGLFST